MTTILSPTAPATPSGVPYHELAARCTGELALRGEASYDQRVSPWNLAVEVTPDAVLTARTAQDVVEAIRFATAHGLQVTPQATGHGPIAALVGQILIDTKGLDECTVHEDGWARVGAGVKWLRVVEAAAPYGLAPLSGSITDVGVVGYTTGGGLGPMARTYGLAIDLVRAIEVVTGDGELRRVTSTDHPDLFHGLRGGKGMLGVVTAVEFGLVQQPTFYGGSLWFDAHDAATVIERWRDWSAELPTQGTTSFALFQLPEEPGVPPMLVNRMTLSIRYAWTGDDEEGAAWFAAMREAAPVILDDVATKPYLAIDSVHTDPLEPIPCFEVATVLTELPDAAIEALLEVAGPQTTSPQVIVEVRQMGGAVAGPERHPSAFCARGAAFAVLGVGITGTPGLEAHSAALLAALEPWRSPYRMPNFSFEPEQLASAYDDATIARLRATSAVYDPHRVLALGRVLDI